MTAEDLVIEARAILAAYLPPDSDMAPADVLDQMLELFDSPDAAAIAEKHGAQVEMVVVHEVERAVGKPVLRVVTDD